MKQIGLPTVDWPNFYRTFQVKRFKLSRRKNVNSIGENKLMVKGCVFPSLENAIRLETITVLAISLLEVKGNDLVNTFFSRRELMLTVTVLCWVIRAKQTHHHQVHSPKSAPFSFCLFFFSPSLSICQWSVGHFRSVLARNCALPIGLHVCEWNSHNDNVGEDKRCNTSLDVLTVTMGFHQQHKIKD